MMKEAVLQYPGGQRRFIRVDDKSQIVEVGWCGADGTGGVVTTFSMDEWEELVGASNVFMEPKEAF